MSNPARRIYQKFDPAQPLDRETHESASLYVDLDDVRGKSAVCKRLENRIRLSDRETCQVLAGHHGSGKSTELFSLKSELEKSANGTLGYFVVYCDVDEDIDRNDVDFPEILVAVIRQTAAQLRKKAKIELKPGYFKDRFQRLKELATTKVSFEGLELDAGLMSLSASLKSGPDTRAEIRKLLEPDTTNWLKAANDVLGEAKVELNKKGYAGLVILLDNLDKMVTRPHADAGRSAEEYLFIHRAAQLTGFLCHTVYTMPLSLAHSHHEPAIRNLYGGHVPVVPMIKIRTRPPAVKPDAAGMKRMREMIDVRANAAGAARKNLFDSDKTCDALIALTGGQPKELMTFVRDGIATHGLPITAKSLERIRIDGRREYARFLREEHTPVLRAIRENGKLPRSEKNENVIRELIDSRAILQYINDDEWYGLNPLIEDLVSVAPKSKPKLKQTTKKRKRSK